MKNADLWQHAAELPDQDYDDYEPTEEEIAAWEAEYARVCAEAADQRMAEREQEQRAMIEAGWINGEPPF